MNVKFWSFFLKSHGQNPYALGQMEPSVVRPPYLQWGNHARMSLQHSGGRLRLQAPYPNSLITAPRGQQCVLKVDSHVGNLCTMTSQCGLEAAVTQPPYLYQTVVCSLKSSNALSACYPLFIHTTVKTCFLGFYDALIPKRSYNADNFTVKTVNQLPLHLSMISNWISHYYLKNSKMPNVVEILFCRIKTYKVVV